MLLDAKRFRQAGIPDCNVETLRCTRAAAFRGGAAISKRKMKTHGVQAMSRYAHRDQAAAAWLVLRTSSPTSKISATWPSPMIVAPEMHGTRR